jgi:RHS repeat-associated protein
VGDSVVAASHDSLNRLTSQTPGGALRFAGSVSEPATVTIQGKSAEVDAANRFMGTASVASGANTVTITAKDGSGNQQTNEYQVNVSGAGTTLTYDANGNLTADGTRTFEWDAENRLLAVTIGTRRSEFSYDGLDRRVRMVEKDSGATIRDAQLIWDGTEISEERLGTGEVNRFFTDGEQHRDHLGSIREVTDSAGTVVTRNDYDPYGRMTRVAGTEDSRFGYTGHMAHAPTGLTLALFRAYDSNSARWISEDPVRDYSSSLYVYGSNNPIRRIDPEGRQDTITPSIVIGAEIGASCGPAGAVFGGILGGLIGLALAMEATKLIDDLANKYTKGGKQRKRDSGLENIK